MTSRSRAGLLAGRPWAAVVLLALLLLLNYFDRLLPAVLAEPLKRDLGLSDTFLGGLNGLGFLAVYALAAVPIARIADTGRYGAVITACLALWSAMTAGATFVATGWQLAFTRAGVAVGEAGLAPASHAYISRNFTPDRRPKALAVLNLAGPIGAMTALACGGLLGEALGWRKTFLTMGLTGLAVSPLALLALGRGEPEAAHRPGADWRELAAHVAKPTVAIILLGNGVVGFAGYVATVFTPAFLIRAHGLGVAAAGVRFGVASGVTGVAAMLFTSTLAARLTRREPRATVFVIALMGLVSVPLGLVAFTAADATVALSFAALSNMTTLAYLPLTIAALHSLVPAHLRAQVSALQLFCAGVLGGLGPLLAGMVSDALTPTLGPMALGRALMLSPAAYGLGGLLYLAATLTLRRDLVEAVSEAA